MKVSEFLRENAPRYTNLEELFTACMKETGKTRTAVQMSWYDVRHSKNPVALGGVQTQPTVKTLHVGISESELRQKHDLKFIIQQAANELKKDNFITDTDFVKQYNLRNQIGYRQYLDDGDFSKYKGKAGGIIYWSHPDSINRMKNEGILR